MVGAAAPASHLDRVQDHLGAHVSGAPPAHPGENVDDEADTLDSAQVGTNVKSVTQSLFGPGALDSRWTRSG